MPSWGPSLRSLDEVAPLLEAVHALLGRSRPATARDYLFAEAGTPAGDTGVKADELEPRVIDLRDAARDAAVALARLLAHDDTLDDAVLDGDPQAFVAANLPATDLVWGDRETFRTAVLAAAAFGAQAPPPSRFGSRAEIAQTLVESAQTGFIDLAGRVAAAGAALAGTGDRGAALLAAARALLGEGAAVLPQIELRNAQELADGVAAAIIASDELDGWLEGAAAVREGAAHLADALALADAFGATAPALAAVQLPHVAGEAWLGGAVPDAASAAGRLSLVVANPDELPGAGAAGVALLADEWTELVPLREETTGVAVHYDQPDSTAPQCVLLAVPPVRGGGWSLAHLVATLHETLELARNRTVELEHLASDVYGQLLPTIVGELVPEAIGTTTEVAGTRVILDFGHNNPTGR